jgi:muramoyltetrapeptide carboxypeptidase
MKNTPSIKPDFLKQGDKIAITATARKISIEEIQPAIAIFKSWGLNVIINDDLFLSENQFAGDDKIRAGNFQNYLDDPSIKAIFCARGGYGTVRIIDQLNFHSFALSPKWIVGYSDITVLHSHVHTHTNIETLHATMPLNMQPLNANDESISSLRKIIFGENISYQISAHHLNKIGEAKAKLIGGNLSVLYSLLGSNSDIDTEGKILFLEDLDEYLYHIDRMIMNLKRTNKLSNLAGLIIGSMSNMKDNAIPFGQTSEEIIYSHIKELDYPVCFNFPSGHEKRNVALKFGAEVLLQTGKDFSKLIF